MKRRARLGRFCASLALAACLSARASAAEPAISIDVRGAELVDVIRLLATESGVNLVPDVSVPRSKVTLRLAHVGFDDALAALAQAYDLQVRRDGGIVLIGTSASMNRRFADRSGPLATKTMVFPLRNARPDEVRKSLIDALAPGTVVVADKRTGALIVTGSEPTLERVRTLLDALDAPVATLAGHPARPIPLRYLRASDALKLIHDFIPEGSAVADDRQNAVLVGGSGESADAAAALLAAVDKPARQVMFEVKVIDMTPLDESSNVGVAFGGIDASGQSLADAVTYAFTRSSIQVNAQLNFLVSKGSAKILATPRLVTLNNREASLLIGQTYPIIYFDIRSGKFVNATRRKVLGERRP